MCLELEHQLEELRLQNHTTQGFKYTKESAANVLSAIRQYLYFTLHFNLRPFPTTVDTLVCYMEFMARTAGHPHLKHLLSSVKYVHQALELQYPVNSFQVDTTMLGLKSSFSSAAPDSNCPEENVLIPEHVPGTRQGFMVLVPHVILRTFAEIQCCAKVQFL